MKYYKLRCVMCGNHFEPVITTTPGDLTNPDWDEVESLAGHMNAEALHQFHREHVIHGLEEVEC